MKRILFALAASAVAWSFGSVPAKAATFPGIGNGDAYAALVAVGSTLPAKVLAGPIAPVGLGCNVFTKSGENRVLALALGTGVISGTAVDTVASTHSSGGATMQATSTIQRVRALNGLITASVVHAVANSVASGAGASSNGNGSSFTGLVVAGVPVLINPAPNTTIALPGLGSVVLNEQILGGSAGFTSIQVNMIHIRISQLNALGLKIGTNIIVAHASSSIQRVPSPVTVSVYTYGLYAQGFAGSLNATSGPHAPASIGCAAGNNTNRILQTQTPVGTTGLIVDNAQGSFTTSGSSAQGKSDITNVNVLGGLVVANAIESFASASLTNARTRFGSTTLLNARIAGISLSANPGPNTRIDIANLGYAILNQQSGNTGATFVNQQVNAIHIYVTTMNTFNLPVGANVIIAHVNAGVTAF